MAIRNLLLPGPQPISYSAWTPSVQLGHWDRRRDEGEGKTPWRSSSPASLGYRTRTSGGSPARNGAAREEPEALRFQLPASLGGFPRQPCRWTEQGGIRLGTGRLLYTERPKGNDHLRPPQQRHHDHRIPKDGEDLSPGASPRVAKDNAIQAQLAKIGLKPSDIEYHPFRPLHLRSQRQVAAPNATLVAGQLVGFLRMTTNIRLLLTFVGDFADTRGEHHPSSTATSIVRRWMAPVMRAPGHTPGSRS